MSKYSVLDMSSLPVAPQPWGHSYLYSQPSMALASVDPNIPIPTPLQACFPTVGEEGGGSGGMNRETVPGLQGWQYLGASCFGIVSSPEKSEVRARGSHGPWVVVSVGCAGPLSSPPVESPSDGSGSLVMLKRQPLAAKGCQFTMTP